MVTAKPALLLGLMAKYTKLQKKQPYLLYTGYDVYMIINNIIIVPLYNYYIPSSN
jgi:hypothetical protein